MNNNEVSPLEISRYIDSNIYEEVTEFHAKGNFTLIPGVEPRCYLSNAPKSMLSNAEGSDVVFWPGFSPEVQLKSDRSTQHDSLLRAESGISFDSAQKISFSIIDKLLVNSFCTRERGSKKRPYPSGGALYPIDVFLCRLSNNIENWPADHNVLHLLPTKWELETMESSSIDALHRGLSGGDICRLGNPYFALVYTVFFERAIFKYRYRGYRLALMEVGSMYQSADINGKSLGLRNRVWAGFTDYQVSKLIGFDPRHVAPLAVQFFGRVNKDD